MEDGEEHVGSREESNTNECDLVIGGAKKRPRLSQLTPRLITEYFPKTRRMTSSGAFGEEDDWFDTWASSYRGRGGEEHTGSIENEVGDAQLPSDLKYNEAPGPIGDVIAVVELDNPGEQGAGVEGHDHDSTDVVQAVQDREYAAGTVQSTEVLTQGVTDIQGVLVGGDAQLPVHRGEQSKDDSQ